MNFYALIITTASHIKAIHLPKKKGNDMPYGIVSQLPSVIYLALKCV